MRRAVLPSVAIVLFAAACSSSVGGSGSAASSGGGSSAAPSAHGTASPSSSPRSGFPTDPQSLAAFLVKGNTSIKTAHLSLVETVGAQRIAGAGDEQLSDGRVQAASQVQHA